MLLYILGFLLFPLVGFSAVQAVAPANPPAQDEALTRSIDQVLTNISSIKPGMTRAQLFHFFTTEGGISTRYEQRYVYRSCPYIKILVKFRKPADAGDNWGRAPEEDWTGDIIQSISKPFLEYSILD